MLSPDYRVAWHPMPWRARQYIARHVNQIILNPRFSSSLASCDVASNICQALGQGVGAGREGHVEEVGGRGGGRGDGGAQGGGRAGHHSTAKSFYMHR